MRTPVSTYRLQLGPSLTFEDAADLVPYLASLGVSHLYLSPILQAAPGSTHGYDVVDHTRVSDVLGGMAGLNRLADTAHAKGLGLILDVVPNHMAAPTPLWHNRALWSLLTLGPASPYAHWFDVDWSAGDGAILMPVLGTRLGEALASGDLHITEASVPTEAGGWVTERVLAYFDHVFPLREGTEGLPLAELVERQHYRLAFWRVGDEELNYRRFFDVGSLVAIRTEDESVFDATHELILDLVTRGIVDGLRIDHPDGLADPTQYLERLAERTGNAWIVVEKILAGEEELSPDWRTAGTTGYDALWRIQQLFIDPGGRSALAGVLTDVAGDAPGTLPRLMEEAKREVITGPLYAEVHRLTDLAAAICRDDPRLRDHTWRGLLQCIQELLVAFDRYRAYVRPGQPPRREAIEAVDAAAALARERLDPQRSQTLDVLVELILGREAGSAGRRREARRDEFVIRFQQVCGAVTAKGVEDTAFYRWTELTALCEVGGEPDRFGVDLHEWHAFAERLQQRNRTGMTTLSTHDTKRGEDTRAVMSVLAGDSTGWARHLREVRVLTQTYRGALVDGRMENLLWQTVAATWGQAGPIDASRLSGYLIKAAREMKTHTSWTAPNERYEAAVLALAETALADSRVLETFEKWDREHAPEIRAAVLGTKIVQLTAPGVADVYQASEDFAPTLVDPDNRRPINGPALAERLERIDMRGPGRALGDEKLFVTAMALRLRAKRPEAFVGDNAGYVPLPVSSPCLVAFARTIDDEPVVASLATRLPRTVHHSGGWRQHTITLPPVDGDEWVDLLSGARHPSGTSRVAGILTENPVALLVPVSSELSELAKDE